MISTHLHLQKISKYSCGLQGGEFIILLLANFPRSEHTVYWHDILHISTHQYINVRSGETHW